MADVSYGTDTACVSDLPIRDVQVSGPIVLVNAIARRLQTTRGALAEIDDDPDYGLDLRQLVGASLTPADVSRWQAEIAAECAKDERVSRAVATLVFTQSTSTLAIEIAITPADELAPFSLVLGVSELTVDVLEVR